MSIKVQLPRPEIVIFVEFFYRCCDITRTLSLRLAKSDFLINSFDIWLWRFRMTCGSNIPLHNEACWLAYHPIRNCVAYWFCCFGYSTYLYRYYRAL